MNEPHLKPWNATDHSQVDAVSAAQGPWFSQSQSQRMRTLWALSENVLAAIESEPSLSEVDAYALRDLAQHLAGCVDKLPALLPQAALPVTAMVTHVGSAPFGVVGIVDHSPDTEPVHMLQWTLAALTAGNSVVVADMHNRWQGTTSALSRAMFNVGMDGSLITVMNANPSSAQWIVCNHPAVAMICLHGLDIESRRALLMSMPDEPRFVETLLGSESSIHLLRLFTRDRRIVQSHGVGEGGFSSGY